MYWDTNLFIYFFEQEHGTLTEQVHALWRRMSVRGHSLATSVLTLGELLAGPAARGEFDRAGPLERLLKEAATLVPFDESAARHFALIRADRTIKPPDAIHLACAAAAHIDVFVTNDSRLTRKAVPGVPIMTSLAAVPI